MRLVRAALVGALVFAAASIAFGGAGWAWRAWSDRRRRDTRPGEDPAAAALRRAREAQAVFYTGLLKALENLGAGKPRWRVPMEHIEAAALRLGPAADDARALTRLYYALRFSPRLLTDAELAEANSRLASVVAAANRAEKTGPRTRDVADSRPAAAPAP